MLFCHPVVGVAENQRSIPNVLRVINGDRSRGAVAKQVRRHAAAEGRLGVLHNPVRQRRLLDVASDFRNPDCVESRRLRIGNKHLIRWSTDTFSPKKNRSMHIEIAFQPRRNRRWDRRLVPNMSLGLLGGELDLP
jgi:hypothetical protein